MLCGLRDYLRITGTGQLSSVVADYLSEKLGKATAIVMSREAVHLRQLLHLLANPDAPLEASDERDFVFAMLGLVTDAKKLGIYSDYSKQRDEIGCDVARAFLQHYDLEILSFCKAAPSSFESSMNPDNPGVPSWAPNWRPKCLPRPLSIRPRFRLTRGEWGRSAYSASGDVENQRVREKHLLPNGVVLLTAIRIDTVDQLGSHLHHATVDGEVSKMIESLAAWLVDMKHLLPEVNETYKTNEDVVDALWRTPIVDRGLAYNYEMVRVDPQLQDGYNDLLSDDSRQRSSRNAVRYADIVRYKLRERKPFRTCRGMIGIGPEETREGDCVWVVVGADLPFVLRPVNDGQWSIVGEACVHGIMDGEAMDMGLKKRLIPLV